MKKQYVVVVGSALDGLSIFGPFEDAERAGYWAESEIEGDWFVSPIQSAWSLT